MFARIYLIGKTKPTLLLSAVLALLIIKPTFSQSSGESLFVKTCKACHTVGQGKVIGPDLYNVHNRRSENWIKRFIKSSQGVINSGDETAVNLFNEFNRSVMPDQPFSNDELNEILLYIKDQSAKVDLAGGPVSAVILPVLNSEGKTLEEADQNDYRKGKNLFSGKERFVNGGAACISCHNVINNEVISGGSLGLDLTTAFTRLSGSGVNTIISNSPFPVMQSAYINQRVSQDEAYSLTVFLKQTDSLYTNQQPLSSDSGFVLLGILGTVVLFGLYGGIWWNRKRKPVNDKIFKRQ
jgi:mono/diheme cytochrome c family protein